MRAAKDVITGVVSAQVSGRAKTFHGIVTLVREVTLSDLGQSIYTVTKGGTATITVLRTGNRAGTHTVHYEATGGTALLADYQAASGTLTFAPNAASATFVVKTNPNTLVDGNRSVNPSSPPRPARARPARGHRDGRAEHRRRGQAGHRQAQPGRIPDPRGRQERRDRDPADPRERRPARSCSSRRRTAPRWPAWTHTATNSSVTFGAGEPSKTVLVPILETAIVDGSRSFTFAITGATPPGTVIGTPASALVTIGDNDVAGSLEFSAAAYSVDEGSTSTITVVRRAGTAGGVLVDFTTADGSARPATITRRPRAHSRSTRPTHPRRSRSRRSMTG